MNILINIMELLVYLLIIVLGLGFLLAAAGPLVLLAEVGLGCIVLKIYFRRNMDLRDETDLRTTFEKIIWKLYFWIGLYSTSNFEVWNSMKRKRMKQQLEKTGSYPERSRRAALNSWEL